MPKRCQNNPYNDTNVKGLQLLGCVAYVEDKNILTLVKFYALINRFFTKNCRMDGVGRSFVYVVLYSRVPPFKNLKL